MESDRIELKRICVWNFIIETKAVVDGFSCISSVCACARSLMMTQLSQYFSIKINDDNNEIDEKKNQNRNKKACAHTHNKK